MRNKLQPDRAVSAGLRRLHALAPLDADADRGLAAAVAQSVHFEARCDVVAEGTPIAGARLILDGWAVRVRQFADGRRQFLSFLLPGELIGLCRHPEPLALSSVMSLSPLTICPAPLPETSPALATAYALSHALDEAYLLEQIMRLGQLTGFERILTLLLELNERLELCGLARDGTFDLPLTQEQLADVIGLTAVHTNRMVQQARRDGLITWQGGQVRLTAPKRLAVLVGRMPIRVSQAWS